MVNIFQSRIYRTNTQKATFLQPKKEGIHVFEIKYKNRENWRIRRRYKKKSARSHHNKNSYWVLPEEGSKELTQIIPQTREIRAKTLPLYKHFYNNPDTSTQITQEGANEFQTILKLKNFKIKENHNKLNYLSDSETPFLALLETSTCKKKEENKLTISSKKIKTDTLQIGESLHSTFKNLKSFKKKQVSFQRLKKNKLKKYLILATALIAWIAYISWPKANPPTSPNLPDRNEILVKESTLEEKTDSPIGRNLKLVSFQIKALNFAGIIQTDTNSKIILKDSSRNKIYYGEPKTLGKDLGQNFKIKNNIDKKINKNYHEPILAVKSLSNNWSYEDKISRREKHAQPRETFQLIIEDQDYPGEFIILNEINKPVSKNAFNYCIQSLNLDNKSIIIEKASLESGTSTQIAIALE